MIDQPGDSLVHAVQDLVGRMLERVLGLPEFRPYRRQEVPASFPGRWAERRSRWIYSLSAPGHEVRCFDQGGWARVAAVSDHGLHRHSRHFELTDPNCPDRLYGAGGSIRAV